VLRALGTAITTTASAMFSLIAVANDMSKPWLIAAVSTVVIAGLIQVPWRRSMPAQPQVATPAPAAAPPRIDIEDSRGWVTRNEFADAGRTDIRARRSDLDIDKNRFKDGQGR
jgi:hypothetical protein